MHGYPVYSDNPDMTCPNIMTCHYNLVQKFKIGKREISKIEDTMALKFLVGNVKGQSGAMMKARMIVRLFTPNTRMEVITLNFPSLFWVILLCDLIIIIHINLHVTISTYLFPLTLIKYPSPMPFLRLALCAHYHLPGKHRKFSIFKSPK